MTKRNMAVIWREQRARADSENAENRQLVLDQPDLAKRLTMPPIGFADPAQWNGYIPPYMTDGPYDAKNDRDTYSRNPSPIRIHLVAIVREAYARTYNEQIARAWLDEVNTDHWNTLPPSSYEAAKIRRKHTGWTPHRVAESSAHDR